MMYGVGTFLILYFLTCVTHIAQGSVIIHGEKAPSYSLLYMASVQNSLGHVCGGFLITKDWVVTAAHCYDDHPTHVVVGSHDLKKSQAKKIAIEKKCKHQSYKEVGLGHDIMLLRLSNKAHIGTNIGIVPVPISDINFEENQVCFVAGWGANITSGHSVQELQEVDVSIINPQVCQRAWTGLPENVICAGGMGTDKGFCQGDSGGPLVCDGTAVGIVSFNSHRNCNYPDKPNVYTDMSKYREWIFKIVNSNKC